MARKTILSYLMMALLGSLGWIGCEQASGTAGESWEEKADYATRVGDAKLYHTAMQKLSDIVVYDIFSPPVASRVYAYPNIAAYEVMAQGNPAFQSLSGQLRDLDSPPAPPADQEISFPIASQEAMFVVARALIFSLDTFDVFTAKRQKMYREMGVPKATYEASIAYGQAIAQHILNWSKGDNYAQTRTMSRYEVRDDVAGRWTPTPPKFMESIEPHWNKIRPFIIDSATQFVPLRPTAYNMSKGSQFFREVMEVYEVGNNLTDEQAEIARFWDCNPYAVKQEGHAMYAVKKITPGGHWIGITKIVTQMNEDDWMHTVEAYTRVSIALADAFISCWDEKYRSNLIRPETVINEQIDDTWMPLLQTPPFPEYTSGHSVISTAAAMTLTDLYGDNFAFNDTTELAYGLPARAYTSFMNASKEAAISRLYGGIHYMPAIENGVAQGEKVGAYVVEHLQTRVGEEDMSMN
ncbi:MAG: vanadium-dependent haloperoxidase [Bacteroidota bacterium]